jgi:hypothetical protein
MEPQKRDRIADELARLVPSSATEEEVALIRSQYFAEQGLWLDALQELYVVKNPSEILKQNIQEITNQICAPSTAASLAP